MQNLILLAVFKSAIFDEIRNSVANVTTYRSNGQNIMKKKMTKIKNPRTLKQRKQRTHFPTLVELADVFTQAIALGLVSRPVRLTAANYFAQLNKKTVSVDDKLEVTIDYSAIQISKGKRAMPEEITTTLDAEKRELTVELVAEEFVNHAADDDEFYCFVLEKKRKKTKLFKLGQRSSLTPSPLVLPGKWDISAENLAIYVFCVSQDGKRASNSVYLNVV